MEKIRIYSITAEQLAGFESTKGGGLIVPDTFEVYIVPSQEDLRKQRITELEAELAQMGEPTSEELVEAGRMMHGYFTLKGELDNLKQK